MRNKSCLIFSLGCMLSVHEILLCLCFAKEITGGFNLSLMEKHINSRAWDIIVVKHLVVSVLFGQYVCVMRVHVAK